MKTYRGLITELPENGIFVFGSNYQGLHKAGTAKIAYEKYGAILGQATGLQGRSWGLITVDLNTKERPNVKPSAILSGIAVLYEFATDVLPEKDFYVAYTATGKNLNGYTAEEMAGMFAQYPIPDNMVFEEEFAKLIEKNPNVNL